MKIREQRILDAHLVGISLVRPRAVYAYAQHFRIELIERAHVVDEASMFIRAGRAPIQRITHHAPTFFFPAKSESFTSFLS